jgi:hypothetical protein
MPYIYLPIKFNTGKSLAFTVNPFPFISVVILGCILLSAFVIFHIEMANLLSSVFCYQYTAEYFENSTISILFLQQGFALFAGFR